MVEILDKAMGAMCGMAVGAFVASGRLLLEFWVLNAFAFLVESFDWDFLYSSAIWSGDALGHPFEYITVTDEIGTSHFDLSKLEFHGEFNKFACKRGQWTDDASMGLCMADSLILCTNFDGSDMRKRFWCWWFRGYNNAFRKDDSRDSKKSIGLGGNTQKSLEPLEVFADGGSKITPPIFAPFLVLPSLCRFEPSQHWMGGKREWSRCCAPRVWVCQRRCWQW